MTQHFWTDDITILWNDFNLIPNPIMTNNQKLNTIMRVSILVTIILMITFGSQFIVLFIISAMITIGLHQSESFVVENMEPTCTMPTKDNPYMNFTMNDYINNIDRKPACDPTQEDIKKEVKDSFNSKFVGTSYDVFEREINSRPWVTMPVTEVINKQKDFAEWLYGSTGQCKSAGINCFKKYDLRYS